MPGSMDWGVLERELCIASPRTCTLSQVMVTLYEGHGLCLQGRQRTQSLEQVHACSQCCVLQPARRPAASLHPRWCASAWCQSAAPMRASTTPARRTACSAASTRRRACGEGRMLSYRAAAPLPASTLIERVHIACMCTANHPASTFCSPPPDGGPVCPKDLLEAAGPCQYRLTPRLLSRPAVPHTVAKRRSPFQQQTNACRIHS